MCASVTMSVQTSVCTCANTRACANVCAHDRGLECGHTGTQRLRVCVGLNVCVWDCAREELATVNTERGSSSETRQLNLPLKVARTVRLLSV